MADRSNPDRRAERTYLVEHYQPRAGSTGLTCAVGRARAAAERLTHDGISVRLLHSLYVPEDENWFLVYEGTSPEAVMEAAREVAIPIERVVEALQIRPDPPSREAEGAT